MEILSFDFLRRSLLGAAIAGPTCALLGIITTSRGQAFFSDSLSHASIAGYGLGLLIELLAFRYFNLSFPETFLSAFLFLYCLGISLCFAYFLNKSKLESDTLLSIIFTGTVAIGILLLTKIVRYPLLESLLFGDINASSWTDIALLGMVAVVSLSFLLFNMPALLLTMIDENMAISEGVEVKKLNYWTVLLIGGVVALSLKLLGALLVSAMIVIPAAAGKIWAWNFRSLLLISLVNGFLGAVGGVILSYYMDAMTGPTIVGCDIFLLLLALLFKNLFKKKNLKTIRNS
ncbi:zinc ABC transporter permease [Methylacidiphilum sp. Yel]|jgi:ABC-type Mn2+/Zn2+ transport system permease subunit|uniref:metal ABC transporter permease n=1 Tax=Methylacidiphilum sp. Yel TaxID=1847730 RepID=UPI00106D0844|nr:metal ABC transporter permease [Methylacidiphilum sp. Yel]TFE68382.1 zinc ABC transporter permease [Methylacidiphilum sp. Yel]